MHTPLSNPTEGKPLSLVADGHVHLYGCYDLSRFFSRALSSLGTLAPPGDALGIFLTERAGCDFFRNTCCQHAEFVPLEQRGEHIVAGRIGELFMFAGRQIATLERLEVLALCSNESFTDGLTFEESLAQVRASGALPVLPWSPGKWIGKRGRIIETALADAKPGELLLADSSLRPRGFPEPAAFRHARSRGFGIIAGTDPLPYSGQESEVGTFGFRMPHFDAGSPLQSVRDALLKPHSTIELVGKRSSLPAVIKRLWKNKCRAES
jgi:hypothetical protein